MSDITTSVNLGRDFTRAAGGQVQQEGQATDRGGSPEESTPEFNRVASQEEETSHENPEMALDREPSSAELKQGEGYDLRSHELGQKIQQDMQQQRSRGQDNSLGY